MVELGFELNSAVLMSLHMLVAQLFPREFLPIIKICNYMVIVSFGQGRVLPYFSLCPCLFLSFSVPANVFCSPLANKPGKRLGTIFCFQAYLRYIFKAVALAHFS